MPVTGDNAKNTSYREHYKQYQLQGTMPKYQLKEIIQKIPHTGSNANNIMHNPM